MGGHYIACKNTITEAAFSIFKASRITYRGMFNFSLTTKMQTGKLTVTQSFKGPLVVFEKSMFLNFIYASIAKSFISAIRSFIKIQVVKMHFVFYFLEKKKKMLFVPHGVAFNI